MKHVYVIEGNFCKDKWIEKLFDSLEKAINYLNTKCPVVELGTIPFCLVWHNELNCYMIREMEVK